MYLFNIYETLLNLAAVVTALIAYLIVTVTGFFFLMTLPHLVPNWEAYSAFLPILWYSLKALSVCVISYIIIGYQGNRLDVAIQEHNQKQDQEEPGVE